MSKKTAAQTVPNFNINQDLVNYFQRQNTENQNVTENQNPLTVESALERIKSYSQKPSQKVTDPGSTIDDQTFDEFFPKDPKSRHLKLRIPLFMIAEMDHKVQKSMIHLQVMHYLNS